MALQLNNFCGFETAGFEEAASGSGTGFVTSPVHPGGSVYALEDELYDVPWVEGGLTDQGDDHIIGFAIRINTGAATSTSAVRIVDASSNVIAEVSLNVTGGTIDLLDANGSTLDSSMYTDGEWHFVEVHFSGLNTASGTWEWFVDGTSEGSGSAADLTDGGSFGGADSLLRVFLQGSGKFVDDAYILSGATASSDRYGNFAVKAYQNTAEDATDNGDTLDDGTWALVSETPGNSGTANDAAYDGTGGSWAGDTVTDEGSRSGPSGDSDVTGATIKGAKFVWTLQRGNGKGHTSQFARYGNSGDGTTDTGDLSLASGTYNNYFVLSEAAGVVPTESESFRIGFGASGDGGQVIRCADQWAMLGFVPAAGGHTAAGILAVPTRTLAGVAVMPPEASGSLTRQDFSLAGSAAQVFIATGSHAAQQRSLAGSLTEIVVVSGDLGRVALTLAGSALEVFFATGDLDRVALDLAGQGLADIVASGNLDAQQRGLAGSAFLRIVASGVLAAQARDLAGQAVAGIVGSGVLDAGTRTLTGSALELILASGALAAQARNLSGAAETNDTTSASGILGMSGRTLAGQGVIGIAGAAILSLASRTLAGVAEEILLASGALDAQQRDLAGSAATDIFVSGSLAAETRTLSGSAAIASFLISGSLAAQSRDLAGQAVAGIVGTGALTAQDRSVTGSAVEIIVAAAVLNAAVRTLAGSGIVGAAATGVLDAVARTLAGAGEQLGTVAATGSLLAVARTLAGVGEEILRTNGSLDRIAMDLTGQGAAVVLGGGVLGAADRTVQGAALERIIASGGILRQPFGILGSGSVLIPITASGLLVRVAYTLTGSGVGGEVIGVPLVEIVGRIVAVTPTGRIISTQIPGRW